jgi:hypothetical protein
LSDEAGRFLAGNRTVLPIPGKHAAETRSERRDVAAAGDMATDLGTGRSLCGSRKPWRSVPKAVRI